VTNNQLFLFFAFFIFSQNPNHRRVALPLLEAALRASSKLNAVALAEG